MFASYMCHVVRSPKVQLDNGTMQDNLVASKVDSTGWSLLVSTAAGSAVGGALVLLVAVLLLIKLYARLTVGVCTSAKDMTGMTVIVTGANTGIGKETARGLAARNARVIMACRSIERGKAAAEEIVASTNNKQVVLKILDLSCMKSVRCFAEDILATEDRLDVLINNAGIKGFYERNLTDDGFEVTFASNYLGHFLLTHLLLDLLKKSAPSRIINVSSVYHRIGRIDFNNLNSEKYHELHRVYGKTKLAQVMHAKVLAEKLQGTGVTINSLHPGMVQTEVLRNMRGVLGFLYRTTFRLFGKDAEEGAQTTLYLAVSKDVASVSGKYFVDCKEAQNAGSANNRATTWKLYQTTERMLEMYL